MNTNDLAKSYGHLTPGERLPLILAAGARGDEVEQKRLSASAPEETYRVPDHYSLAKAFGEAGHYHLLALLDLAANFWQWWGLWMSYGLRQSGKTATKTTKRGPASADKTKERRAGGIVRYYATRFVAHVEGWKQFCEAMHIDPEVQLHFMIGWETVLRTEERARDLAFTAEEAAQFVRLETVAVEGDREKGPIPVESAESLAEGWHLLLDKLRQAH
jgi:hypothetical protein